MPDDKNGNQFCPNCGLQKAKQSAPGSITGYMFDPVRCKCTDQSGGSGPTFKPAALNGRTFSAVGATTPTEMQLHEGDLVGGSYSIIELLGSGGMGVVYLARHVGLGKRCAIKLIPPDQLTSTAWGRFQLEAKSVAKLDHKNIVKVTDLGLHKGYMPFYAMEYIKGRSLADRLAQDGPFPLKDALSIFIQICEGVDYAHRAGIIHRDLKPANIMLGDDGTVKILDFGLAKLAHQNRNEQSLTAVGDIFGSPYYMSPEQCAGEKVDNRSDIYSLGCTLFECLTGRPPFAGSISSAVIFAQQESPPPSLESVLGKNKMPESIEIILAKILRKNPAERYQTCRELGVDLQRGLDGKNVEPVYVDTGAKKSTNNSQASIQTASPPAQSKAPKIFITLAVALLLIGAVAGFAVYSCLKPRTAIVHYSESLRDTETPLLVSSRDLTKEINRLRTVPLSANQKGYYSTAESAGRAIKTFNFPADVRIGVISNTLASDTPAVGKVIIDITDLKFWPGPATIKNPQYFSRFRPGEISKVMFSGQNLDLSFETVEDDFEDVNACCHALTFLPGWQDLPSLGLWHLNQTLTPASVKVLSSLKSLRSLDAAGPATDCKALAKLPFMHTLVEVNLSGLRDYLSLFKGFKTAPHLTLIRIDRANFSDEELKALSEIKSLNSLILETENVTTRDLSRLAALKSIQNLSLHHSTFRDYSAVKALKLFPSVRWLRIVGVPLKDQGRLEFLRRSLPSLRVDFVESFYGP